MNGIKHISEAAFQNEFVSRFPGDTSGSTQPRQTPGMLWSKALPTPVKNVTMIAWNERLASEMGIEKPVYQKDIDVLGGNATSPSMEPYAACYAGHQFGSWAGQLGDGRAITMGERIARSGDTWELQWKGAGPTAYSRRADGRAVLRSSVREYLMSEAMHYLGVPTTRALSLVTTGDDVLRDMFYDGHPAYEPGAIVVRAAPSFLRFGNFELLAARGETENLKNLLQWTIQKHYPQLNGSDKVLQWYNEVVQRTAHLMSEWMRVGFVHGVMNTDNMSILGMTIDYGPYSFVDQYDPLFTPNTTDLPGRRYAFGQQPSVAKWNLGCLGGALAALYPDTENLIHIIDTYDEVYWNHYYTMMANKIGLDQVRKEDEALIHSLDDLLRNLQPDMTLFFLNLMELGNREVTGDEVVQHFKSALYTEPSSAQAAQLHQWIEQYKKRLLLQVEDKADRYAKMQKANPRFVLRNYLLHDAIEKLQAGDDQLFRQLEKALQHPYTDAGPDLSGKRPIWANEKAGCSMLSCSS